MEILIANNIINNRRVHNFSGFEEGISHYQVESIRPMS